MKALHELSMVAGLVCVVENINCNLLFECDDTKSELIFVTDGDICNLAITLEVKMQALF